MTSRTARDKSKIIPDTIFTNITTVPPQAGEDQLAAFIFHNGYGMV